MDLEPNGLVDPRGKPVDYVDDMDP